MSRENGLNSKMASAALKARRLQRENSMAAIGMPSNWRRQAKAWQYHQLKANGAGANGAAA